MFRSIPEKTSSQVQQAHSESIGETVQIEYMRGQFIAQVSGSTKKMGRIMKDYLRQGDKLDEVKMSYKIKVTVTPDGIDGSILSPMPWVKG